MKNHPDVDRHIASFPPDVRDRLEKVRNCIRKAAPAADETIAYGIPTYRIGKANLVHFAGYKGHVGFYPGASGIHMFQKEISLYKNAKGSVQFPHDAPLPLALIARITKARLKEEQEKTGPASFASGLAAPARRALQNAGITDLRKLARLSENEILSMHGMGPSSIPKLRKMLEAAGLRFAAHTDKT